MARGRWVYTGSAKGNKPPEAEKRAIGQACESFIAEVLKPRFLPEIRPTEFNYCVDIFGKWHGGKYRFIQRLRSDKPEVAHDPEFDHPFARLGYVSRDRFDLAYFRHTEQWWTLHRYVTLAEALSLMQTDGHFHPINL